MAQSKRFKALLETVPESPVALGEAVKLLKTFEGTKFDQTVEIHMNLGIDAKQADQLVRGSLVLPNGCLLYTSPSPRDQRGSRMPSSA